VKRFGFLIGAAMAASVSIASAGAQPAPPAGAPGISPDLIRRIGAIEAAAKLLPDTPGTGAYPAVKAEDTSLPDHTIYRPDKLAEVHGKLPIVVWGNGGCAADGAGQRFHLLEIASHGYLVIANGGIKSGPGTAPAPPPPAPPVGPNGQFVPPPPKTSAGQLTQAIDWAIAENARPASPFYGKLDTARIAASGWSCGGVQALTVSTSDPRITTTVIHNSGLFSGGPRMPGMELEKAALAKLQAPIIYILGGPTDIAYVNGTDDYARIGQVPIAMANLDVGHGGSFFEPNGGKAAQVAVAWLNWRLKGDAAGAAWFAGADCTLCKSADWKYEHKGF